MANACKVPVRRPCILWISNQDLLASLGIVLVICSLTFVVLVVLITLLGVVVTPKESSAVILILSIGVVFVGTALLRWRIRFVRKFLERGEEVKAHVTECRMSMLPSRRHALAELAYNFQGKEYRITRKVMMKTMFKPPYEAGDEVILVLDPDNPKRFLVWDDLL